MESYYWIVDQHAALSQGVRNWLVETFGYTAPADHTYVATISLRAESASGERCLVTFPFSFAMEGAQAGDLEDQIGAECRARLKALRNSEPISSIADIRHPL